MLKIRGRQRKKQLAASQLKARQLLIARKEREALEFLEEAIEQVPLDPDLRLLYATILLAFRPEDVATEAAKAAELGSDNPEVLVGAGHRLLFGGKLEAARSCARQASDLVQPDFALMPSLRNLTGLIAAFDGDDHQAEMDLRSAFESDPDNAHFAKNLAVFLAERGRLRDAVPVLDEALKHAENKDDLERMRSRMATEAGS